MAIGEFAVPVLVQSQSPGGQLVLDGRQSRHDRGLTVTHDRHPLGPGGRPLERSVAPRIQTSCPGRHRAAGGDLVNLQGHTGGRTTPSVYHHRSLRVGPALRAWCGAFAGPGERLDGLCRAGEPAMAHQDQNRSSGTGWRRWEQTVAQASAQLLRADPPQTRPASCSLPRCPLAAPPHGHSAAADPQWQSLFTER